MAVIRVPKPPKKAYDPTRPAGTLLQSQLKHLEWAVRPAAARTEKAFRIKPAKTEAEASARIAKLNEALHYQATSPRDVMPPVTALPAAPAGPPTARKAARKTKTTRTSKATRPSKTVSRSRRSPRRRRSR